MEKNNLQEWFDRVKEFTTKIKVEMDMRPELFSSKEFLEMHWLADDVAKMEDQMQQLLVERTAAKVIDDESS